jgi:hypothetical protein
MAPLGWRMGGQARPGAGGGRRRRVGAHHSYHPPLRAGNRACGGRDDTIALPKDAEVLDNLRAIRMEKGIAKVPNAARTRDAKGGQRHGDAAIALALGHYASRQESISYEYHRVAPRERDDDLPVRPVRTGRAGFGLQRGVW